MKLPFIFKILLLLIILFFLISNSHFIFSIKFRQYVSKTFLKLLKKFSK